MSEERPPDGRRFDDIVRSERYFTATLLPAILFHDVGRVAIVGDTPLDLQAAMNARAGWVIGVLSGAHGIETLGATPHTHLLPSVASLRKLFGV